MAKHDIETATPEEINEAVEDGIKCGSCSECACSRNNWENHGEEISHCTEVLGLLYKKLLSEQKDAKPPEPKASNASLDYQSTIGFMKKRGYRHCYMCGSDLNKGE